MNQKSFLLNLLIISLFFFFIACEKDENIIDSHDYSHKDKSIITFREFLDKTKIKNFNSNINLLNDNSNNLRQTSDFIGFVVDTTVIKQHLQKNDNYTFTLPVIPQPYANTENIFYNIVFYKTSNTWQWSVLEYQNVNLNSKNYTVKEIVNESNHNGLINMRLQGYWGTTYTYHCTNTGDCTSGTCDLCSQCVSETTGYYYVNIEEPEYQFEIISPDPNSGGGGGGGVAFQYLLDDFKSTLSPQQLPIYNSAIQQYLLNNVIEAPKLTLNDPLLTNNDNNTTTYIISPEAINFVIELIESEINGILISFFPTFKYPINSNYSSIYPNFTILIKEYIPLLKNDQRLITTIHNLTNVPISNIINDLTWEKGPEINITQLGLDINGNEYHGKFNIENPEKIYIDIDLVLEIEELSNLTNPTQQEQQQLAFLNAMITFSVCLHEYVHYSDFAFDGTMQDNETLELGLLFEEIYLGGYYEFTPNGNVIFIKKN